MKISLIVLFGLFAVSWAGTLDEIRGKINSVKHGKAAPTISSKEQRRKAHLSQQQQTSKSTTASLLKTLFDVKNWNNRRGCNGQVKVFNNEGAIIKSPRHPRKYPHNALCEFQVQAPAGMGITLTATAFNLEDTTDCFADSLCAYPQASDGTEEFMGCFCGRDNNLVLTTTENVLDLVFMTDRTKKRTGFRFELSFFPVDTDDSGSGSGSGDGPSTDCGGDYFSPEGGYVSTPSPYGNDALCIWNIETDPDKRIELRFESMDIEGLPEDGCPYDQLVVTETGSGSLLGDFCGAFKPGDVTSVSNKVTLTFRSDFSIIGGGFALRWRAVGGGGGGGLPPGTGPVLNNTCGVPAIRAAGLMARIVGGEEAIRGSWPWQISLRHDGGHICGGSIISNKYIVTASHCVEFDPSSPSSFSIAAGEHDRSKNEGSESYINVKKITMHPQYNPDTIDNDIAILELDQELTFSDYIKPICLPGGPDPLPGLNCVTTGWGETLGTGSNIVLREVNLPFLTQAQCNDMYDGLITSNMICAGYPEGEKDSCQGDSGGPLVCRTPSGHWALFGVTSWGFGCAQAGNPGVYARVTRLRNFITSVTGIEPAA